MTDTTQPPMPDSPPPPAPKKSRTNTIIIGSAAAVIAAIVTTGILVANSNSDDTGEPTVAKASTTEPASSPTPSPTPSARQETYRYGEVAEVTSGGFDFTATVIGFKDTGIVGIPEIQQAGQKWAAAEVKVCNTGEEAFLVSPFVWSLAYADGARVEPTHMTGGGFPQPLYPMDARVKGGDCVRGHVLFEVPKSGRAERVLYSPQDLVESVEWAVK